MDNPSYYMSLVAALLAMLGLNLFFSLCETGFSSLSRTKLKNMAEKDKPGRQAKRAKTALKMLDSYDKLLSSILIGNTFINVAASAIATVLFISLFGAKGVSLTTLVMTLVVLIFCEIAPKTLAKRSPELTALAVTPLLRFLTIIFTPLSYLAEAWQKAIVKIFPAKGERSITEDEFLTFVEEARQEGGINQQEEKMIRQVIEFDEITAAEIITPRIDLAAVEEHETPAGIDRVFAETGFSRLPVYRENIDNIIGVILFKDFHHEVVNKGRLPGEIVKPVVYAARTMKITLLLKTLQEKQSHMAVLVDEFGGTLGIVTIEDIVEELVGDIWDEHDEKVEEFRLNTDGSVTVLGGAHLQDLIAFINSGAAAENPVEEENLPDTTVASWVMENAGGHLRAGGHFDWKNLRVTITRVQRHRVMEVNVTLPVNTVYSGEVSKELQKTGKNP